MDINEVLQKMNSVDESFLNKWQEFIQSWSSEKLQECLMMQDLGEENEPSFKLSYKDVQKELGTISEIEKVACMGFVASWVAVNRYRRSQGMDPFIVTSDVPMELVDLAYNDLQNNPSFNKTNKSGCFIATATFGDYNSPEVKFFRCWRDEILMQLWVGRLFVEVYYMISPLLAKQIKMNENIKNGSRVMLNGLIKILRG